MLMLCQISNKKKKKKKIWRQSLFFPALFPINVSETFSSTYTLRFITKCCKNEAKNLYDINRWLLCVLTHK